MIIITINTEDFIAAKFPEFQECISQLQQQLQQKLILEHSTAREFEVVFLGTGAALPSKYRNGMHSSKNVDHAILAHFLCRHLRIIIVFARITKSKPRIVMKISLFSHEQIFPSKFLIVSSIYMEYSQHNSAMLLDAGEGSYGQLFRKYGTEFDSVSHFILFKSL